MLKKIMKRVRRQLLKVNWIKREVEAYKLKQKKARHHKDWAKLMHSGRKVRNLKSEKLDITDTLKIITIDGLFVDYLGGKVVGQGYVEPVYIDSVNWGINH